MRRRFRSRNAGLSFGDPAFDPDYDEEEDFDNYVSACEAREDSLRESY